jgi:hypothetical protein
MKKLYLTLLAATATFSLLPSVSQALCSTTGAINGVHIQNSLTNIGVRTSRPLALAYNFTTTNALLTNAALIAESSHMTVIITGNAAVCPPVNSQGFVAGGNVISILVSP